MSKQKTTVEEFVGKVLYDDFDLVIYSKSPNGEKKLLADIGISGKLGHEVGRFIADAINEKAQQTQPAPVSQSEFQEDIKKLEHGVIIDGIRPGPLWELVSSFVSKYRNAQPAPVESVTESQFQKDIEDLEISVIEERIPTGPIWDFIVKYRDHVSGRFVPESEIEELRRSYQISKKRSHMSGKFLADGVLDFLQAIEKGGSSE